VALRQATRAFYSKLACGAKLAPAYEALEKLAEPSALADCSLLVECSSESHLTALDGDPAVLEQDALAGQADNLVWQLCRQSAFTSAQLTDTIVGQLAKFWGEEPGSRDDCKHWLQARYKTFRTASEIGTPALKTLLRKSDCNRPVERLCLDRLQAVDFAEWPENLKRDLDWIFKAEPSTGIVENAFKELRAAESGSDLDLFLFFFILTTC
jgi:hypothetical protein